MNAWSYLRPAASISRSPVDTCGGSEWQGRHPLHVRFIWCRRACCVHMGQVQAGPGAGRGRCRQGQGQTGAVQTGLKWRAQAGCTHSIPCPAKLEAPHQCRWGGQVQPNFGCMQSVGGRARMNQGGAACGVGWGCAEQRVGGSGLAAAPSGAVYSLIAHSPIVSSVAVSRLSNVVCQQSYTCVQGRGGDCVCSAHAGGRQG